MAHSFILDLTPASKIEREFEQNSWADLIADQPAAAKVEYYKELESICDHLFGPLNEKVRCICKLDHFCYKHLCFCDFDRNNH